jgi:hypothetical protein
MARNATKAKRKAKRPKTAEHAEARLNTPASLFSEESARRIIDDWLVPVLVEEFLRSKKNSLKSDEGKA